MDNRENQITPENPEQLAGQAPENWAPTNPEHNLSELGSNAMNNAIISSTPDSEPSASQPDDSFKITDVFPNETPKSDSKKETEEPKLIFNPSDITPKEEGITQSTEAAARSIENLIIRGDDPKDAYTNYQALRKVVAEPTPTTGGEGK